MSLSRYLPAALLLLSCSGGGHSHADDGGMFVDCATDPRADPYMAGLERMGAGGRLRIKLLASDPGPPIKGNNAWTIEVSDAGGAPQPSATLKVTPFMPDHGHGTPRAPAVTTDASPGRYVVSPLYLYMAGLWDVTFDVTNGAGVQDAAVFHICIPQ